MTRAIQPEGQVFGERLRQVRKRRGLTQEELATRADLAGPYIGDMERSLKVLSLTTVLQLAIALECKVTHLVEAFDKMDVPALLRK